MPHLDEGTIHAWLDGALPDEERVNVERHVAGCESCAAAVAEARGFVAGATRILSALDDAPSAAIPGKGSAGGGARSPAGRRSLWRTLHFTPARAAAAAVLIVAAGTYLTVKEAGRSGDFGLTKREVEAVKTDSSLPNANAASVPTAGTAHPSAPLPPPPRETGAPAATTLESKKMARRPQTAAKAAAEPSLTARRPEVVRDAQPRPNVVREEAKLSELVVTAAPVVDSASIKLRGVSHLAGSAPSVVGCYAVTTTNPDKDASALPSLISLDSAPAFVEALRGDAESVAQQRERRFTPAPPAAAARAPASAGARAPAPAPAPPAAASGDASASRVDSIARIGPRTVSILPQPGEALAMGNVGSAVRGYWTPAADGSVFVRLPSIAGAAPRSLVLRAAPNGLSGMLQEAGRSVPVSLRRVTCR